MARQKKEEIWTPTEEKMMKLIILTEAHNGAEVHCGLTATFKIVSEHFVWKGLEEYFKTFVTSCLHCASTDSSVTIPLPLRQAMYASKPNEIIQFDYCYIVRGKDYVTYVLILKYDLSGYVWLLTYQKAGSHSTVDDLTK